MKISTLKAKCLSLGRADHLGDPLRGLADLVVDAGLLLDRAAEAGRRDAHQGPAAFDVDDEGAAAVTKTGILEQNIRFSHTSALR